MQAGRRAGLNFFHIPPFLCTLISGRKVKTRTQCRHCAGPVRQFSIVFHAKLEILKPSPPGPIRRHGLRELSSIPNEIYLEIMSYLKPSNSLSADSGSLTQDLRNVARVCRFFCSIALPWIFESFCLIIGRDETGSGPENRTKFCRRLLNGEEAAQTVARFVKKCTVLLSAQCNGIGWVLQELLSMYSKAIAHMPNVEEIVLSHVIIKKDALKSLAKLKRLKTLQITHCQLAPDVKEKSLAKISTLRLSSLDISFLPSADLATDEPNPNIVSFLNQINWSCITKFTATTIPTTIQSAWMSSKGLPLVELDLLCIEMAPLLCLLEKTPSLKLLRVVDIPPPQQTPPDSSAAPLLEELEAPLPLCMMLVPGRPVVNLSLRTVELQETLLGPTEARIFQTASCPISQLKVPLHFYLKAPFWRHFPSLRVLHLDLQGLLQGLNIPIQQVRWSSCLRRSLSLTPFRQFQSLPNLGLDIRVYIRLSSNWAHSGKICNPSTSNSNIP